MGSLGRISSIKKIKLGIIATEGVEVDEEHDIVVGDEDSSTGCEITIGKLTTNAGEIPVSDGSLLGSESDTAAALGSEGREGEDLLRLDKYHFPIILSPTNTFDNTR